MGGLLVFNFVQCYSWTLETSLNALFRVHSRMYFFKLQSKEYSVFPTGPISVYVCLCPLMHFCVFAKQLRAH